MSKEGESFGADCSPLGMGNQTKGLNTGWCHFGEDMGGLFIQFQDLINGGSCAKWKYKDARMLDVDLVFNPAKKKCFHHFAWGLVHLSGCQVLAFRCSL